MSHPFAAIAESASLKKPMATFKLVQGGYFAGLMDTYEGEIFNLLKLRTMHPYSEFIQNYVYAQRNIDESGKFRDDFRVTSWGRVLRKFWLDELLQLFNWARGRADSERINPDFWKFRLA